MINEINDVNEIEDLECEVETETEMDAPDNWESNIIFVRNELGEVEVVNIADDVEEG